MARLKLAYEDVASVNPGIVYCAAVGFGQGGAYADKPALDDMIQGLAAIPSLQQRLTGRTSFVPFNLADRICGMAFTQAILAALLCRARTGVGQAVELPMFETMADFVVSEHLWGRTFVPPAGELGATRQFDRRPLATKDGHICFWIGSAEQSARLFEAIGRPELQHDARFKTRADLNRNLADFYTEVEAALAARTTAEWMTALETADIPVMPLHTLEGMLADPHLNDVGFFKTVRHPTEGVIVTTAVPSQWSATPPHNPRHAPSVGEHSVEILREAGYSEAEADDLIARNIVRAA
jgi:crotonobetainyl-CoA:carnitine CoA-transferase CaiB-like acyl-CoA transferase